MANPMAGFPKPPENWDGQPGDAISEFYGEVERWLRSRAGALRDVIDAQETLERAQIRLANAQNCFERTRAGTPPASQSVLPSLMGTVSVTGLSHG